MSALATQSTVRGRQQKITNSSNGLFRGKFITPGSLCRLSSLLSRFYPVAGIYSPVWVRNSTPTGPCTIRVCFLVGKTFYNASEFTVTILRGIYVKSISVWRPSSDRYLARPLPLLVLQMRSRPSFTILTSHPRRMCTTIVFTASDRMSGLWPSHCYFVL